MVVANFMSFLFGQYCIADVPWEREQLLPKLEKEGHRILIFSQWTRLLDIVEDYIRYKCVGHSCPFVPVCPCECSQHS